MSAIEAITRLREMHHPVTGHSWSGSWEYCPADGEKWPCAMAPIIDELIAEHECLAAAEVEPR